MKILIACSFSGLDREAFAKFGHDVWSCDILPTEIPGQHYQGNVLDVLDDNWDMLIAHPPCTDLTSSGARWFKEKQADGRQKKSIEFFMKFVNTKIPKKMIENPIGIMSTYYRKPDQIIQPWMFGHGETKATCLWLTELPKLIPTNIVPGREHRIWKMPPSKEREKLRGNQFMGIAEAMAQQWGENKDVAC